MSSPATFRGYKIISDQVGQGELNVVWRELEKSLAAGVPGDIVEFGCYAGTTSLFIRRLLDQTGESAKRTFHVYDSFEGLPPKTGPDESPAGTDFQAGKLSVSKKEFLQQFRAANLRPPIVHKGWFNQLTEKDVPPLIAFAFLDGDFYDSVMDSLKLVWPHLSPGGVILIDDYAREALPGPERALRNYFGGNPPQLHLEHNIAIIKA
jgi:O-methyltransferase